MANTLYCLPGDFRFLKSSRQPKNFPPGPRKPLPLIGDAYLLGGNLYKGFEKFREEFGPAVGLYLGPQRTVVLNDFDLIQEAFQKDEFQDRLYIKAVFAQLPGKSI